MNTFIVLRGFFYSIGVISELQECSYDFYFIIEDQLKLAGENENLRTKKDYKLIRCWEIPRRNQTI